MNETLTQATTWMDFENVMLSEVSQTQKDKYFTILLPWGAWNTQLETKQNGDGPGHRELLFSAFSFFLDNEKAEYRWQRW